MIGILIIAHGTLAESLIHCASHVLGKRPMRVRQLGVTIHDDPAAILPLASVVNDGAGAAVWRLPPGVDRVERVPVALVTLDGATALVRGALADGDLIVSLGANKIDPSRPVRVVETAASPES
jgi:hypothetical protein